MAIQVTRSLICYAGHFESECATRGCTMGDLQQHWPYIRPDAVLEAYCHDDLSGTYQGVYISLNTALSIYWLICVDHPGHGVWKPRERYLECFRFVCNSCWETLGRMQHGMLGSVLGTGVFNSDGMSWIILGRFLCSSDCLTNSLGDMWRLAVWL